jgi:murein DD-endopeptidase MepM/ murein hydrolase activator NlpD
MPRKRITFIVIPANDGQVREYRFPSWMLWMGMLAAFCFMGAFGYFAKGFYLKVDQEEALEALGDENGELLRSVELTRREVQQLGETMEQLVADDDLLRAYHQMEPLSADMRQVGVGGSEDLPEDFTALPLAKRKMVRELSQRIDYLKRMASLQEESFEEIEHKYLEKEGDLKHYPTISPVRKGTAWKSSPFGKRIDPFTGLQAFHSGVDFAGRKGTPIYATANGIVTYAYTDLRLGKVVVIEHNIEEENEQGVTYLRQGVWRTEYGHLDKILVKTGDRVKRRQQIGVMGDTGRSTGPHLHYSVRFQDRRRGGHRGYKDPKDFILDDKAVLDAEVSNWFDAEE